MAYDEFPDDVSLRFRVHVLCAYAQSTLKFADELADEGAKNLSEDDLKALDDMVDQLERIWFEGAKIKKRARDS